MINFNNNKNREQNREKIRSKIEENSRKLDKEERQMKIR